MVIHNIYEIAISSAKLKISTAKYILPFVSAYFMAVLGNLLMAFYFHSFSGEKFILENVGF